MHISEGVLSAPILITGAVLAAGGVAVGLRKTPTEAVPKVAILSATFFVASLIHVPFGPTSVHLLLNGLVGLLLGWAAFPAILVGLILQAVLFQYGGITVLGVNTFTMAFPALLCYYLTSPLVRCENRTLMLIGGALAGVLGVLLSAICLALALVSTGKSLRMVAEIALAAHLPVMLIEGMLTAFCVLFLSRVKPELLGGKR